MADFLKSAVNEADFPQSDKEIVFVGRSNVGKSSLINALYQGKLAYVGKKPGKTRMINFFATKGYTFADVPGYGFANRSEKEISEFGSMMEKYFRKRQGLQLCVVILDVRHLPSHDDLDMIEYLESLKIPYLLVLNKADKLSHQQLIRQERLLKAELKKPDNLFLTVSAEKRTGIDELKRVIEETLEI